MTDINSTAENQIKDWNQTIVEKVAIRLDVTGHKEDDSFKNVAGQLTRYASNLEINVEESENDLPGFILSENISFHAFPAEKELEPFLNTLSRLNTHSGEPNHGHDFEKIDIPVELNLYIALMCPHCPQMVNTLVPLAIGDPNIHLNIIDGSLFPELAQKNRVMAAPCLILDNDFRWTGSVSAEEVHKMICDRDPATLSVESLKNILEQGDASWITHQMIETGKIFDSVIQLLIHETWSVRLGAMVIVEELAEANPGLAADLCSPLMQIYGQKDTTVQGDILYALGEAGSLDIIEWINAQIPEMDHPDLIESANDAIDTLEQRHA